jgi:hypothetical protein
MKSGMSEDDWKKFDAITDADIEKAIADDADWQGIDLSNNAGWKIAYPDGRRVVPLILDAQTANFINEYHLDYQSFLAGVLKSYIETYKH